MGAKIFRLEAARRDPAFYDLLAAQARRARERKGEARVMQYRREVFAALWRKQFGQAFPTR